MNKLTLALFITLTSGSGTILAASHEHDMHHNMSSHAMQPATQQGSGIVKAINTSTSKVQIAHEPIPALEWPAMTMWFELSVPFPNEIKAGDSVRFELAQTPTKKWMIIRIERKH